MRDLMLSLRLNNPNTIISGLGTTSPAETFPVFLTFQKTPLEGLILLGLILKMGVPFVILSMFVRKKLNSSGSTSVQIIAKIRGKCMVFKTIGCSYNEQELQKLFYLGNQEIERLDSQPGLFVSERDSIVEQVFSAIGNSSIHTVGPELVFGKIYDSIGFGWLCNRVRYF